MFIEWGFLLAEIWVLLALAALIGLIAGWIIWGGRDAGDNGFANEEIKRLHAEILRMKTSQRASLSQNPIDDVPPMQGGGYVRPSMAKPTPKPPAPVQPTPAPVLAPTPAPQPTPVARPTPTPAPAPKPDPIPTPQPTPTPPAAMPSVSMSNKPNGLESPRDGIPDDLTKIKGVGAKMEKLCNSLGFWHYDQIAAWSANEVAWVDDNLEGFKGRVTRDGWVQQARTLAKNETPAFVRRKD